MAAVLATALCLVLSSFLPLTHSQTGSSFTLPCTINTTGSAWDGELAFDLSGSTGSYLVVMDTNGTVLNFRESAGTDGYNAAYFIAPDTLMFQGEPETSVPNTVWGTYATHLWNLTSDTTVDFPNVLGEHDIQYDPINNTFLTLQDYVRQVGTNLILYDRIVQLDPNGNVLWSWDTYGNIPLSEASPYNETATTVDGQTVEDFTHANSLDWDYNNSIIYLNLRNTNTFYAINQTTGNIIWACGEFGNFTLVGANGLPPSLWYGCHDVKEVAPDVFTMFNNDYANTTNPDDCQSSMLEVTLNETSMTAYVDWSWEAPTQYWNEYGGATLILPNGDFIADFGDPTHQFQQNSENGGDLSWDFANTGAVFVEVNPAGQIVRTWTFPVGYYVYRIEATTILTPATTPTPTPITTPTPVTTPTSTPAASPTSTPVTSPTSTLFTTSTPSVSPSSTPLISINSQTIIASVVLAAVVVAAVVLAVLFYMKKRTTNHKIHANKENP